VYCAAAANSSLFTLHSSFQIFPLGAAKFLLKGCIIFPLSFDTAKVQHWHCGSRMIDKLFSNFSVAVLQLLQLKIS
jgi:hypothetical protein